MFAFTWFRFEQSLEVWKMIGTPTWGALALEFSFTPFRRSNTKQNTTATTEENIYIYIEGRLNLSVIEPESSSTKTLDFCRVPPIHCAVDISE